MGVDLLIAPACRCSSCGRTIFDVGRSPRALPRGRRSPSTIAENDYTAVVKLGSKVTVTANVAESGISLSYCGTNLPPCSGRDERDKLQGVRRQPDR